MHEIEKFFVLSIFTASGKKTGTTSQTLTCGLDLKLKIAFVLMQRSIGQTASRATYPPATLYNDNICACKTKAGTHLVVRKHP